ncbi:MAG TPA: SdrD B-like domain-containing protein, partial [Candidatus Sulfomarinibacteraceae bacterium]|nr:SdrD B-like domain-containing protein [Candidatus Sulfomarinibacteraceae bacterium]
RHHRAHPYYLEETMSLTLTMPLTLKRCSHILLLLALAVVLGACSLLDQQQDDADTPVAEATDTPTDDGGQVTAEANVEDVEILVLESFPVQVNVIAIGTLPDGCTSLNEPTPRLEGNTFVINLTTTRLEDEVCTQAVVPFDKIVSLDVEGLSAGTYRVAVNGVTDTFTLDVDNVAQEEPTGDEGQPTADAGSISGRVWHDLCAVAGGEGGQAAVPSDGCVAVDDGYQANGIMEEDEPGIEGVVVTLGEGACPSDGLDSTTTGADGEFSFSGLEPGAYCVTVDALTDENATILVPGDWTSPQPEDNTATVASTVDVTAGAGSGDVNFGWDYQFLPEPDEGLTAAKDCTDSASFQADITVQDNEILPPGFVFTKTWQLENSGTCTWDDNYALVLAYGDPIGASQEVIPLQETVAPTGTVQLSVPMVAPDLNGTYRGEWLLRNELGDTFGIPGPFWTQIVITSSIPEVGSYVNGLVWADSCDAADDAETAPDGCVAREEGGFVADGVYDVAEARIEGVTVALAEGACPAEGSVQTTTTDAYGRYAFTELEAGTYCVFIDAAASQNQALLMPGLWSWPEVSEDPVGYTVELVDGDTVTDAYFGWDFQFE